MRKGMVCLAAGAFLTASTGAFAVPDLKITEIYVGVPGDDVTEDWFELTNLGDTAWDLTTDPLWYDDESADTADAVSITGISSIAPDESVIVVLGSAPEDITFFSTWDDGGSLAGVQIGLADGSGLGQGGDGVTIFDDLVSPNIVTSEVSPDYDANPGELGNTAVYNPVTETFGDFADVGVFGAYEAPGGPAGDAGEYPLVGSPGVLPEPASLLLIGIGSLLLLRRRR